MNQLIQIRISGKVQGVYYRKSTKIKADKLGVCGTIQNLPDGDVVVIAFGVQSALDELVAWTKIGPQNARVESIVVNKLPANQHFEDFQIIG